MQDVPVPTPTSSVPTPTSALVSAPVSNPWPVPTAPSGPPRKRNEVRVHKDANGLTRSSNKLKKQTERKSGKGASKASSGRTSTAPDEGDESDVPSEIKDQERAVEGKKGCKGVQAFQQCELVALAFAGDNVVQVRVPPNDAPVLTLHMHG